MNKLYMISIYLFTSISPVYWFFGVPSALLAFAKYGLLAIALLTSLFFYKSQKLYTLLKRLGIYEVFLLIIIIVIIHLVNLNYNFFPIMQLGYIFLLMYLYAIFFLIGGRFKKILFFTMLPILVGSVYSIVNLFLGVDLGQPSELLDPVFTTGFNFSRTGWSTSLAIFIISSLFLSLDENISKKFLLFLFIIFIAQIISGGRGGILASSLAFLYFFLVKEGATYKVLLFFLVSLITFLIVSNLDLFFLYMRLDRLQSGGDVTAGRLDQLFMAFSYLEYTSFLPKGYASYLQYFYDNGIKGEGSSTYMKVHNVWIGELIQYGILFVLIKFIWLFRRFKYIYKSNKSGLIFLSFCLLPTLLEPSVIFWVVTNYSLWWCFLSYLIYKSLNKPSKCSTQSHAF